VTTNVSWETYGPFVYSILEKFPKGAFKTQVEKIYSKEHQESLPFNWADMLEKRFISIVKVNDKNLWLKCLPLHESIRLREDDIQLSTDGNDPYEQCPEHEHVPQLPVASTMTRSLLELLKRSSMAPQLYSESNSFDETGDQLYSDLESNYSDETGVQLYSNLESNSSDETVNQLYSDLESNSSVETVIQLYSDLESDTEEEFDMHEDIIRKDEGVCGLTSPPLTPPQSPYLELETDCNQLYSDLSDSDWSTSSDEELNEVPQPCINNLSKYYARSSVKDNPDSDMVESSTLQPEEAGHSYPLTPPNSAQSDRRSIRNMVQSTSNAQVLGVSSLVMCLECTHVMINQRVKKLNQNEESESTINSCQECNSQRITELYSTSA